MDTLEADKRIVLRIFAGLKAGSGQFVPLKTVLLNWPPAVSGARLADAVEALAAEGVLCPDAAATAYALTGGLAAA